MGLSHIHSAHARRTDLYGVDTITVTQSDDQCTLNPQWTKYFWPYCSVINCTNHTTGQWGTIVYLWDLTLSQHRHHATSSEWDEFPLPCISEEMPLKRMSIDLLNAHTTWQRHGLLTRDLTMEWTVFTALPMNTVHAICDTLLTLWSSMDGHLTDRPAIQ